MAMKETVSFIVMEVLSAAEVEKIIPVMTTHGECPLVMRATFGFGSSFAMVLYGNAYADKAPYLQEATLFWVASFLFISAVRRIEQLSMAIVYLCLRF